LFDYEKKFLVIGNINAITYKEIFPLIKKNRLWLGNGFKRSCAHFFSPYKSESKWLEVENFKKQGITIPEGLYVTRVAGVHWFTNLEHGKRHQKLQLSTMARNLKYNPKIKDKNAYKKYDNYDAIEVPLTAAIPSDYEGIMGVPISFLDKYNPEQFEIIGATESEGKGFSEGLWDGTSKITQPVIERERESIRDYLSSLRIVGHKKYDRPYINNKRLYFRILIRKATK
jgi:hypothetical protein